MLAGCILKTDGVVLCPDTHLHTVKAKHQQSGEEGLKNVSVCACVYSCMCITEAGDHTLCSGSPSMASTSRSCLIVCVALLSKTVVQIILTHSYTNNEPQQNKAEQCNLVNFELTSNH